jgi:hypothetical protein
VLYAHLGLGALDEHPEAPLRLVPEVEADDDDALRNLFGVDRAAHRPQDEVRIEVLEGCLDPAGVPDAQRVQQRPQLAATLAQRLGIEQTADALIDLGERPGAAHPGRKLLTLVHRAPSFSRDVRFIRG